jgi:hypothetical protein
MSNRRVLGTGGGSAFSSGGTTNNILPKEDGSGGLKDSLVSDSGTALTYNSKVVPSWTTGGVTTNTIPKTSGTAGLLADSQIVDNGTSVIFPNGTTANPAIVFTSQTGTGWSYGFELSQNNLKASAGGSLVGDFSNSFGLGLYSGLRLNFSGSNSAGTHDAFFGRSAAATLQLGAGDVNGTPVNQTLRSQGAITGTDLPGGNLTILPGLGTGAGASSSLIISVPVVAASSGTAQTAFALETWKGATSADPANNTATMAGTHGEGWVRGSNTELLTLSTGGLTTLTTNNLLPANAIIEAVVCRVTTTITTTTNWAVGDATTTSRFSSANATLTANTTSVGLNHWSGAVTTLAAGPSQAAAAKVQITCTGSNPGAGVVRITVFYSQWIAPTS